jgi:hypothetical protein
LVKKYVDGESKEKRKQRKALEKLAKLDQELGLYDIPYNQNTLINDKYYVLCLKHGTKYSADYVNKLYSMVQRHCTLDIEFVCLTENSAGINENIKILPLPSGLSGWWCKPYMFSNDLPLKGTVLYMDLDVVIANNIDQLFLYSPNNWCTIRDFTRAQRPDWQKYNSSVIKFDTGELDFVWQDFFKKRNNVQAKYFGDQDYLYAATTHRPAKLFPDNWIQSWKWEIRKDKTLAPGGRGNRKLKNIEYAVPPKDCCICVFHGDPNPHNCYDPWVLDNWK